VSNESHTLSASTERERERAGGDLNPCCSGPSERPRGPCFSPARGPRVPATPAGHWVCLWWKRRGDCDSISLFHFYRCALMLLHNEKRQRRELALAFSSRHESMLQGCL